MNAVRTVRQKTHGRKGTTQNVQAIAEAAFALMAEHRIAPTPANYQICFDYVRGENTVLCEEFAALLSARGGPGEGLLVQIFDRYFGDTEETSLIKQTNLRVHDELEKVLSNLQIAESDTHKFGNVLEGYSGSLEAVTDINTVRQLIGGLMDEARGMEKKSRTLEGRLQDSSQEIDKLKRNLEAVRTEAITDDLTGIGNRKHFEQVLNNLSADARDSNSALSLIFGDVDHFKNFNDTWGHQLGDQVLKLVAHHLRAQVGEFGIAARYGGEEFAVLLPGVPLDEAAEIADRIRESVCKKAMKSKSTGATIGRITMSFGVSCFDNRENPMDFVARADHALYLAKNNGRNRVETQETVPEAKAC